jgi:amino acid transporter
MTCFLSVTIAIVNSYDTRWAARVQIFFTGAKLIALLIISIGGLVRLGQGMFIKVMFYCLGLWIN